MGSKKVRPLRVAIWGATGTTGSELVRQCLAEPRIGEVRVFSRRPLSDGSPKLKEILVDDFLDLSTIKGKLRSIDAAYWCLGVSQSRVPQHERYREITHDYTLAAAYAVQRESPGAVFHFVSGKGADPSGRSRMMWARVKGETEARLSTLGLRRLVVWRPGYIHAISRRENPSPGDRVAMFLSPIIRLIPGLTNTTVAIAHAMLHVTFEDEGNALYGSKAINWLAHEYRGSQNTR